MQDYIIKSAAWRPAGRHLIARSMLASLFSVLACTAIAGAVSKATHVDLVGKDDGISRPDYSRYKNMAYPAPDVGNAQSDAARAAFKSLRTNNENDNTPSWSLLAPPVSPVPASVTYTGRAFTAAGRVTALALTPGCKDDDFGSCRAFLGAAGGGVWVAKHPFSGNLHWTVASTGLDSNAIGSLAVDPRARGKIIYAGTGEQNSSGDSEAGVGLFKSIDGGTTWHVLPASVPFANGLSIATITIDPRDSSHLYFGTMSALHGAAASANPSLPPQTANLGLYESHDGGASFARVLNTAPGGNFTGGVMQILLDPNDLDTVYLSIFGFGVVRSSLSLDGDTQFRTVFATGAPNDGFNRLVIALARKDETTRIYLGDSLDAPGTSYIYRVDNARVPAKALSNGTTNAGWIALSNHTPGSAGFGSFGFCQGQCFYDIYIATPPDHPDTVWIGGSMNYPEIFGQVPAASNGRAVMRSNNAGVSFTDMTRDAKVPAGGMHPDQHTLVFNPHNSIQVLAGSDGGVVRTSGQLIDATAQCTTRGLTGADLVDCGSWLAAIPTVIEPVNDGLTTLQFQSVAFDPRNVDSTWMGGTQDNGTWAFGEASAAFFESIGGDGGNTGFDAVDSNIRFHTYYNPQVDVNFQGAATAGWDWIADPLLGSGESSEFYVPIIADPIVGGSIFAGLQHVWRTVDSGGARAYLDLHCNEFTGDFTVMCGDWMPLGADLTGPSFGADRSGGVVALVTRSTGDSHNMWTGTSRGRVFLTNNADAPDPATVTFQRVDSITSPLRVISGIAVDARNARHAWVSYTGYGAYTPTTPGHVFEVNVNKNGSANFNDISYNLGDLPVTALARDEKRGDLFVGTDFGVLMLKKGSTQWVVAGNGLPPTAVYQLGLTRSGDLYAATHGRSMWRLTTQ